MGAKKWEFQDKRGNASASDKESPFAGGEQDEGEALTEKGGWGMWTAGEMERVHVSAIALEGGESSMDIIAEPRACQLVVD